MSTPASKRRRVGYLLGAPLRRRGLLIAPTLVASLVATGIALLLPARYRAAAILQAEWEDAVAASGPEAELASRRARAIQQRLAEGTLLERTLQQATPYGGGSGSVTLARQVERLRSDLRVRAMAASSFAVEFEHGDPVKASLVPNVLTGLLVEETEAARRAELAARPQSALPRFELVAPARVPSAPEPRHPLLFALAAALVGLLVGVAAAVVAEARDRSVKGPEDLEAILSVPLLASVPEVRNRERED